MHSLELIWQQSQTGDRLGVKKELARLLREQPGNVQGWLLMATLLDEPAQQAECYRKVLRLDPQNGRATTMLQKAASSEMPSSEMPSSEMPSSEMASSEMPSSQMASFEMPSSEIAPSGTTSQLDASETEPQQRSAPQIPELFDYTTEGAIDEERLAALAREDLTKFVVRELGSGADRNTLIRYICETGEMSWPEAEKFMARVALEHEHEIAKRQSPLMLALSVATFIGGIILALAGGYALYTYFFGEPFLRLDFAYYGLVTGLGMTGGGLIGLLRTLRSMHDNAS